MTLLPLRPGDLKGAPSWEVLRDLMTPQSLLAPCLPSASLLPRKPPLSAMPAEPSLKKKCHLEAKASAGLGKYPAFFLQRRAGTGQVAPS